MRQGRGRPRECYEAANTVDPDNLIRGDLEVSEVPAVWNDRMDEYLGVRPATDAEGCLQDTHWAGASFGYFPTYSLGSMLAAQVFAAAERELGPLDDRIEAGEFDPLANWLTDGIHRHGCRHTTPDLVRSATGEDPTATHFLEYARKKYGELHDIGY